MTREESEKYIKSKMCNNCGIYLGGGKCSDNCNVIEAIQALSQEPINEIVQKAYEDGKKDGYVQAKVEQEPCDDAISREEAIKVLRADTLFVCTGDKMQAISDIEGLSPVTQNTGHWIEGEKTPG